MQFGLKYELFGIPTVVSRPDSGWTSAEELLRGAIDGNVVGV